MHLIYIYTHTHNGTKGCATDYRVCDWGFFPLTSKQGVCQLCYSGRDIFDRLQRTSNMQPHSSQSLPKETSQACSTRVPIRYSFQQTRSCISMTQSQRNQFKPHIGQSVQPRSNPFHTFCSHCKN